MAYRDKADERAYQAAHYQANKGLYKQRAKESRKRLRAERQQYIRDLKSRTPCDDCGLNYPYYVMDFDHLEDKVMNVCRLANNGTMKTLLAEIQKCEIVCANCHRERTYQRRPLGGMADATGLNPVL